MSGFFDLSSIECAVIDTCKLYNPNLFGAHIAVALDFYPVFLTISMYVLSLYRYELYFALISVSLTLNWIINTIIQRFIIGEAVRFPDCGSPFQMPSFSSQHIVLFETMMFLYMLTWCSKVKIKLLILIRLFTFAVLVSRIYIGINTIPQLLVGGAIGFSLAILYHLIILYIIFPYFSNILNWTLIRWMGLEDNMCRRSNWKRATRGNKAFQNALRIIAGEIEKMPNENKTHYIKFKLKTKRHVLIKIE
jgi:membrane-associated phospholipid phosphatase